MTPCANRACDYQHPGGSCMYTGDPAQVCGKRQAPAPAPDPGPAPFRVGDWVQYHEAVGKGAKAQRVSAVKVDAAGIWKWQSPTCLWRECRQYRVVAKDVDAPRPGPGTLPVGTRVKARQPNPNFSGHRYYFGGNVLTVAGQTQGGDYFFLEGAGSWPRESLEVVE